MSKTKKDAGAKPSNDNRHWAPEDDRLLVDLFNRHVPKTQIAAVMGRTLRAIGQRIWDKHQDAWEASGHPEVSTRAATTTEGQPDALTRIEAKLDQSIAMQRILLRALGEERPVDEAPANGRAHT